MILNVDYAYTANTTAKGQRNARTRYFLASVPVEIAEATGVEAPVALRATGEMRFDQAERVREYRLHGDRLWLPVARGREDAKPYRAEDLPGEAAAETGRDRGRDAHGLFSAARIQESGIEGRIEAAPNVHRVWWTDAETREAEVVASLADYLLVDGTLYEPAEEPAFEVDDDRQYTFLRLVEARAPFSGTSGEPNYGNRLYRPDEDAYVRARFDLAEGDGLRNPRIEILIPEAIRAPLPEFALMRACDVALGDLAKEALKRDVAFFADYVALRDLLPPLQAELARRTAVMRARGTWPDDGPIETAALAEALRNGIRRIEESRDPDFGRSLAAKWAEDALGRMEARDMAAMPAMSLG